MSLGKNPHHQRTIGDLLLLETPKDVPLETPRLSLETPYFRCIFVESPILGVPNENLRVSNENLGVLNEIMGVFNVNMGSPIVLI